MLKSPTITVDLYISPLSLTKFWLTYFVVLLFGAYTFKIAVSSGWVDLLCNVAL